VTGCSSFGNYTGAGFLTWNGTTQLTQAVGNEAANTTYDLSLLAGSLGDLNAPGIYTFQLLAGTTPLITMTGSMSSMPLLYLTPDKQAWGLYGQAFDGKSVETPATVAPNTPLTIVLSLSTDVGGTGGPLGVTNVALTSAQNYIPGDINGDGLVDVADYNIWAANVGKTGATWAQGDLNGDGLVDVADYNIWAANVGRTSATPEPISMLILAIGGGLVALKRSSILRPQAQGRKD
jgi:hypothetical protein